MVDSDETWIDREYVGHDFRDQDLSRLRTERVVFTECNFSGVDMTGEQWAQLATASAIWIVLPFVLGLVRVMRAELK